MVYVFLLNNFELVEALATVDILKRAKIEVTTVSITEEKGVNSSSQVRDLADKMLSECDFKHAEAVVLPGGPGVFAALECQSLCDLLVSRYENKELIGAICAAPAVLSKLGIKVASTVYPTLANEIEKYVDEHVVRDGHVITGRSMGHSI